MQENIIEFTKKLLFEQAKSAMSSYDSMQDSLDKAYLTIMFGNIAFYATKIDIHSTKFYLDFFSISFMAFVLALILYSFMRSKSMMRILYTNTLLEIEVLEVKNIVIKDIEIKINNNLKIINKHNLIIENLNWQIPWMIGLAAYLCLIKVSPYYLNLKIFLTVWILGVIIICLILRKNNYVKK